MKKLVSVLIFLLLATYLILLWVLNGATFTTDFQESYANPELGQASFTLNGGEEINVLYDKKSGSGDVILYFHGNVGRLPYIMEYLAASPYSFIAPAYAGYNGSSGSPSVANVYEAALKVRPMIEEIFGKDINLHILAHSLGSQPAVHFASRFNGFAKTLIIVGGFDSVYGLCKVRLGALWPACIVAKNSFDAIKDIRDGSSPLELRLLSFHKVDDPIVPFSLGQKLFAALAATQKEFTTLQDGTHGHFDVEGVLHRAVVRN